MSKEDALKRLGFNTEWLSSGIISEEYLLAQYEKILVSEDKNAEHYRCSAFYDFLKSRSSLSEIEIDTIFNLKDNGPDKCDLRKNRIIELIQSEVLNDVQLEWIMQYPEVSEQPVQKRYLRSKLIRKINNTSLCECFDDIKACDDSHVHEYILKRSDLKRTHIEWMSENAGNKKLRNVAGQLLMSKRFRHA